MRDCIHEGCTSRQAVLPGGLNVPRRAPAMYDRLAGSGDLLNQPAADSVRELESSNEAWVDLFALAVNEQNAAGGRIVTGADERFGGSDSRSAHVLLAFHRECEYGGGEEVPAHRIGNRIPHQAQCLDFRSRGRVPGGGGIRMLHGRGWAWCAVSGEILGRWRTPRRLHGAPSGTHQRPHRRIGADSHASNATP